MLIIQFVLLNIIFIVLIDKYASKNILKSINKYIVEIVYIFVSISMLIAFSDKYKNITNWVYILSILLMYQLIKKIYYELSVENNQLIIYRIYIFINNQIRAGIRTEDVISGIYKVIYKKSTKERVKKYCLIYKQNYNLDVFLKNLEKEFIGDDFSSIKYSIRNSVKIGETKNVMTFQEEMMFNKYVGVIKKTGDRNKVKLFFSALFLSIMLFINISYPLFLEFVDSLEKLY